MSPDFFNLFHVGWLFIASYEHVYQCYECPNDKSNGKNVIIVKCIVKSHIVYLYSKNHVNLSISSVSRE